MNEYLALLLGIICAGIGGELFVKGTVGLAGMARISPAIVATTFVAFATSSPELSVSISSALSGQPQIALGDALGSNVVNVALVLGLALVMSGIQSPRSSVKRDFPVAMLIPVITGVLFIDGVLSRIDGVLLLGMFLTWLIATVIDAQRQRKAANSIPYSHAPWRVVLCCVAGIVLLVTAGNLIVLGASELALSLGFSEFIIGSVIVAIGTSVPELATTIMSRIRGYDEVGLGTVLGSNIFNGVFIIGVAAVIHPIVLPLREIAATLVFGLLALVIVMPPISGFIERRRGVLLLVIYVAYVVIALQSGVE